MHDSILQLKSKLLRKHKQISLTSKLMPNVNETITKILTHQKFIENTIPQLRITINEVI